MEMTPLPQSNTNALPDAPQSLIRLNQSLPEAWELGDWLPITWIPATEAELDYMEFVRARVTKEHEEYINELKQRYAKNI